MAPTTHAPTHARSYPVRDTSDDDAGRAWNWARNSVLTDAGSVAAPTTEDELRELLRTTTGRVRLSGSRMSTGRLLEPAEPGDLLVDLRGLRGVIGEVGDLLVDLRGLRGVIGEVGDDTATFAGGTLLQEVYDVLAEHGRTLPAAPGVIAEQTLGGALATGTHGQGLRQSSIGDAVTCLRMVLADGSVQQMDASDPRFGAALLGLGSLGVVTAVTLRTIRTLVYTCTKAATSADTLEDDLLAWNRGSLMSKAWWFPEDDRVHVWTAHEATPEEVAEYREGGSRLVERSERSAEMNDAVDAALAHMRADTRIVDAQGKPFRTVTRFKDFSDVTGDVYQVFMRGIATPQINVEIGVPLARAGAVIRRLRDWYAETNPHLHYPIILRCTGPSGAWLSPSHDQDTVFFGFVVYYAEDGSLSPEGVEFLFEVERLLAAEGGRPHWGKYFDDALYDWRAVYPRFAEFAAVRDELDPQRRFSNAFTDRLFPPADGADDLDDVA